MTDHPDHDQLRSWALRLALALYLHQVDSFNYLDSSNEIKTEIEAHDGCWGCLTSTALVLLTDVLEDMNDGDTDAVTTWLERELATELDQGAASKKPPAT